MSRVAAVACLALVALAGCGSGGSSPGAAGPAARPAAATVQPQTRAATLTTHRSRYGRILTDGRGRTLYVFTRDADSRSRCYGACARAWPPYFARGQVRATGAARQRLLGATRRRDGRRQVTYAGRPVYFYVGDRKPGQILCQNVVEFGGTWLVADAAGRPVR